MQNLFLVNERRGRLEIRQTEQALKLLANLQITFDDDAREESVLNLARKYRLSFYDASYLELAQRKDCALASLDSALVKAARQEGVILLQGQ